MKDLQGIVDRIFQEWVDTSTSSSSNAVDEALVARGVPRMFLESPEQYTTPTKKAKTHSSALEMALATPPLPGKKGEVKNLAEEVQASQAPIPLPPATIPMYRADGKVAATASAVAMAPRACVETAHKGNERSTVRVKEGVGKWYAEVLVYHRQESASSTAETSCNDC